MITVIQQVIWPFQLQFGRKGVERDGVSNAMAFASKGFAFDASNAMAFPKASNAMAFPEKKKIHRLDICQAAPARLPRCTRPAVKRLLICRSSPLVK